MNPILHALRTLALVAAASAAVGACEGFLTVENPNTVDAESLDPEDDAAMFSLSARQNFAQAYGHLIVHSAFFTGEALPGETWGDVNHIGRRDVSPGNGTLLSQLWSPLSIARASADKAAEHLVRAPGAGSNIHAARALLFSGFSYLFIAEHFCRGATPAGGLSTEQALDTAAARFSRALAVAQAAAPAAKRDVKAEAEQIAGAALVGRARAHLQAGRKAEAAADAARVPPGFVYELEYSDDPSQIFRLGNRVWFHTARRRILSIAPAFRQLDDPRVPVNAPRPGLRAFDGVTPLWTQAKYSGFDAPIRLASKVEADYIAAEAGGTGAMLALIQARRAANGQPPYAGPIDAASVLSELLDQRSREFFLEGKRLGDARRHPQAVRNLPQPGAAFHKPGYEPIRDQSCYPLPEKETKSNPNL
jgi:hypothetical protein